MKLLISGMRSLTFVKSVSLTLMLLFNIEVSVSERGAHKQVIDRTSDLSNDYYDNLKYKNRQNGQNRKPINCDRIDSDFFRYLLRQYKKDQRIGRMDRVCGDLEYAATHCHQNTEHLFNLIHNPQTHHNEDDHNFSQSVIRLSPLILFTLTGTHQKCAAVISIDAPLKPDLKHVWGFAFLFVTIISCCSLVGVVVMPFSNTNTDSYKDAFNLFEGLAVGSLMASSLFHLLPQAFNLTGSKDDDYLVKGMLTFGGIYLFFWSEILMKLMAELRRRKKKKSICQTNLELLESEAKVMRDLKAKDESDSNGLAKKDRNESEQEIAHVAWMIIFGDGLHNFIDGLSIGAAFSESIMSGISVSITVICEELPHELGDFAVLIASGMTMKQAIDKLRPR